MKPIGQNEVREIRETLELAEANFKERTIAKIRELLPKYLTDEILAATSSSLIKMKKSAIDIDMACMVAYVHLRSISENDGQSPYARITKYLKANDVAICNLQIKAITELLLKIEFLKLERKEDKGKHQCRVYSVPTDVLIALGIKGQNS